jgi:hypothetical protein
MDTATVRRVLAVVALICAVLSLGLPLDALLIVAVVLLSVAALI